VNVTLKDLAYRFRSDPVGYAKYYLGRPLTYQQQDAVKLLLKPPYRLLVRSANNVGKSFLAAVLASWFYDTRDPSITLCTAPKITSVRDILFRELRSIRPSLSGFLPKSTRLQSGPSHFIDGLTCSNEERFKGRHERHMMFVLDEAVGIPTWLFTAVDSMFQSTGEHYQLCLFNPTDRSSRVSQLEDSGAMPCYVMSALDHPNIVGCELIHNAISPSTIHSRIERECYRIKIDEDKPGSFIFKGERYVPHTIEFFVQVLGRWPIFSTASVWPDQVLEAMRTASVAVTDSSPIVVGVDVARFGQDASCIAIRHGRKLLSLNSYYSVDGRTLSNLIKESISSLCELIHKERGILIDGTQIPVFVDVGGGGFSVVDHRESFRFIGINSGMLGIEPEKYPNLRSELWFGTRALCEEYPIDISSIPEDVQAKLIQQLRSPFYSLDRTGRRVVEPKADMKKRLTRSPDEADAFNLAFLPPDYHPYQS
jgi:hypothetical protein